MGSSAPENRGGQVDGKKNRGRKFGMLTSCEGRKKLPEKETGC